MKNSTSPSFSRRTLLKASAILFGTSLIDVHKTDAAIPIIT